jgi:hypothetical protein
VPAVWLSNADGHSQRQLVPEGVGEVIGSAGPDAWIFYTAVDRSTEALTSLSSVGMKGRAAALLRLQAEPLGVGPSASPTCFGAPPSRSPPR